MTVAWGAGWIVARGLMIAPQGFSQPQEEVDLHTQCAELNRQAVMPSPDTFGGLSIRSIFGGLRP